MFSMSKKAAPAESFVVEELSEEQLTQVAGGCGCHHEPAPAPEHHHHKHHHHHHHHKHQSSSSHPQGHRVWKKEWEKVWVCD